MRQLLWVEGGFSRVWYGVLNSELYSTIVSPEFTVDGDALAIVCVELILAQQLENFHPFN